MTGTNIDDPIGYLEGLGGLHDSHILLLAWNSKEKSICISLDDICSNTLGYEDYPGPEPALIIFSGVVETDITIQNFDEISRVYAVEIHKEESMFNVRVLCSPGGYVQCKCAEIKLENETSS